MLQFEVLQYRMKNEYGVDIVVRGLPFEYARWVVADKVTKDIIGHTDNALLVEDKYKRPVILFRDQWLMNRIMEKNKGIKLLDIPPSI
jgi:peptide chain release factor 3